MYHEIKYFFLTKKVWYMKWAKLKLEHSVIIVLEDIRDETLISHVDTNRPFFSPSNFFTSLFIFIQMVSKSPCGMLTDLSSNKNTICFYSFVDPGGVFATKYSAQLSHISRREKSPGKVETGKLVAAYSICANSQSSTFNR